MKQGITLHWSKQALPLLVLGLSGALTLALWITRLNLVLLICMIACGIAAVLTLLSTLLRRRLSGYLPLSCGVLLLGVFARAVLQGADAGFSGFSSGLAGFTSAAHPWLTGEGSFFTRLLGNLLLLLPCALLLAAIFLLCRRLTRKQALQTLLIRLSSLLLVAATAGFILTMNLRMSPVTQRLWAGHDDYLKNIAADRTRSNAPNVLFILMDDLGYGDLSFHGARYATPAIDRIAEEGASLENFYSGNALCSPSRFAALTGRYPYRGYADNVMYPTVNTLSPFAATRLYNSIEMGNNADGMLGDEITIAEALQAAGYATGGFGKWHLGDYGEYLPTNQGFDYFYGSHYVNDMTPFYHVAEAGGQYEIVRGTDELKDQSQATAWIHAEIDGWIRDTVSQGDQPFFAYYASPWPHTPIFVSEEYQGKSGFGDYADCVLEFDAYLAKLFDTLEELGVLDDTLILFTSDNGPALQGSTGGLRGGKGLVYDGGQKVPFFMRWGNGGLFEPGTIYSQSAAFVDLFPSLIDLCGVTDLTGSHSFLPQDRLLDGVSILPILTEHVPIHGKNSPILYMKRGKLKSIQYTVEQNEYITFKYLERVQNDNTAFFDKYRENWLHILDDDPGENYNRASVYPEVAREMQEILAQTMQNLKDNRRGILS